MIEKLKNNKKLIINLIGGLAVVLLVIFPEPSQLTTWQEVGRQVNGFIRNPYEIGLSIVAVYGYITNLK